MHLIDTFVDSPKQLKCSLLEKLGLRIISDLGIPGISKKQKSEKRSKKKH